MTCTRHLGLPPEAEARPGVTKRAGSPRSSAMVKLAYSVGLCRQHSATSPSPALRVWAALHEAAPLPFPLHRPPPPRPNPRCQGQGYPNPYHVCPAPLPWEPGMTSATQSYHLSHPRLLETLPALSISRLGHRGTGLAARSSPAPPKLEWAGPIGRGGAGGGAVRVAAPAPAQSHGRGLGCS